MGENSFVSKKVFIAEKPSVAKEFAKALDEKFQSRDGYLESDQSYVTWCVGHLVTMSYPESYDPVYKRWSFDTIPFIPDTFRYEVIDSVKKQFNIVKNILNRPDIEMIYVCTDSGREGEYIYRLVEMQAEVGEKQRKRVWIDSQTEEEIRRGIETAKDLSEYDNLSASAFLRAKEDYLMGINFSRVLTLKYSNSVKTHLKEDRAVISVGRVMTCVLGMVVDREREIRNFTETPFYRVIGNFNFREHDFDAEWKAVESSKYFQSPCLYKENGFKEEKDAKELIELLLNPSDIPVVDSLEKKKENKNPPLLYNLAELQNDCSKLFKISPDETLRIVQELYEKKLTTYPRTDARVLSTAVTKEIDKNLKGLTNYSILSDYAKEILNKKAYTGLKNTRYVNDKQITDHYAIIPTGQGIGTLNSLTPTAAHVYELIARRFLAIFYPAAVYRKVLVSIRLKDEKFFSSFKVLSEPGYLPITELSFSRKKDSALLEKGKAEQDSKNEEQNEEKPESDTEDKVLDVEFLSVLEQMKKGEPLALNSLTMKEGKTSAPKRYNSGSIILAMENAGQLIEDEELRAQIKGSGIGTSATRAEILKKLNHIKYISTNKKTQIIMPTKMGEMIYEVVNNSIRALLNPKLTASWEKGLTMVAQGEITEEEYMRKLDDFVRNKTNQVKSIRNENEMQRRYQIISTYYK